MNILDYQCSNEYERMTLDIYRLATLVEHFKLSDLYELRKSQLKGDELYIVRPMTDHYLIAHISEEARNIMHKYEGKGDYLFSFADMFSTYNSFRYRINESWNAIKASLGIDSQHPVVMFARSGYFRNGNNHLKTY